MESKIKTFKEAYQAIRELNLFLDDKHKMLVPVVSNDVAEKLLRYVSFSSYAISKIAEKEGNCGDFADNCCGLTSHGKLDEQCKKCKIKVNWNDE